MPDPIFFLRKWVDTYLQFCHCEPYTGLMEFCKGMHVNTNVSLLPQDFVHHMIENLGLVS